MSNKFNLFPKENVAGVFRGFREGGLEFHADLVLPYKNEFQSLPMHGQFLLVQLETPDEAILGRITSFSSEGKLSSFSGEEFSIRAVREERPIPEDLREQYLKYRVNIRVLGVVRNGTNSKITFAPSQRRLPHVGSKVAFLSGEVLQEIAGHNEIGSPIGHFSLGEYVYGINSKLLYVPEWIQVISPEVLTKFAVESLVSRRTFIFARAGFGKSNLNKLLFSELYKETPVINKRGNTKVPVGTIIFDPDGEYFWPDDKGRPGLCDVPSLQDKVVLFTSKRNKSPFYQSFVAGGIKLDIRRMRPGDVIAISLGQERQDQQNVRKLRSLNQEKWEELVNLIDKDKNLTPLTDIARILDLDAKNQEAEALAARANMTAIVNMLHDKSSQLMDMLIWALSKGKLCVIDTSQLRGSQSMVLSGLILRRIFDRNQQEFTEAEPKTIPVIAVIEEAQTVLNESNTTNDPFIAWVKEGRKYDLGAVMVTQQPVSIPSEILSQGDNWFVFHLLSSIDLTSVKKANAHFSDDLLSVLLNEPIPGQGIYWSSVAGKPYPISLRILSFEKMYPVLDLKFEKAAVNTYAKELKLRFNNVVSASPKDLFSENEDWDKLGNPEEPSLQKDKIDPLEDMENATLAKFSKNEQLLQRIKKDGVPWGELNKYFEGQLPRELEDLSDRAYYMVKKALDKEFTQKGSGWYTFKNEKTGNTWVRAS